jgi:hypothetical protein
MNRAGNVKLLIFTLVAAWFLFAPRAHAYLDPGTGSFLIQMMIAGFVGAVFALKVFWKNVKDFVGGLVGRRPSDPQDDE